MAEIVPFERWLRLKSAEKSGRVFSDTPGGEMPLPDEALRWPMAEQQAPLASDFSHPVGDPNEMLAKLARGHMQDAYQRGTNPLEAWKARQEQLRNLTGNEPRRPSSLPELVTFLKLMRGM